MDVNRFKKGQAWRLCLRHECFGWMPEDSVCPGCVADPPPPVTTMVVKAIDHDTGTITLSSLN